MEKAYIVLQRTNSTSVKGPFCFLKVANEDEQMDLALWDTAEDMPPKMGELVYFREGGIKTQGDRKSCARLDISCRGLAPETHPLYALIPRPIKREEWDRTVDNLLGMMTNDKIATLFRQQADALFDKYLLFPAATSVHHAFPGGLLNHTHQMLHMLEGLYPVLPYPDEVKVDRLAIAILFHDYGKMYEYDQEGNMQEDMALLGHIYLGANKLQNIMLQAKIDWEEVKRTIHIVLAHHGQLEYGSPVLPCTSEAAIVTYLDNISAKTDTIHGSAHMDRVRALGTNVVKE